MKTFTRTMRILVVMGALILTNLSFLTNAWGQTTCYSVNGQSDKLYKLSMAGSITGVDSALLSYSSSTLDNVGAIAYSENNSNDTLWIMDDDHLYFIVNPASSSNVDRLTSSEVDNNISENSNAYNGMSFDKDGRLWVVNADEASSSTIFLGVINRKTGLIDYNLTPGGDIIEVSGIDFGTVTAMEIDPLTNTIYMTVQNGGMSLYRVELAAGSPYTAVAVRVGGLGAVSAQGLTYNADGDLIASTSNGRFYKIDANAALWKQITSTATGTQINGLACKSDGIDYIGISGYIYDDADLSGMMESDENGRNNASVFLYIDTDQDGVLDPSETTIKDSAVTNLNGFYEFRIPFAGNQMYIIVADANDYPDNTIYEINKLAIDPYKSGTGAAGDYYSGYNFSYHFGLLMTGRVYYDDDKDGTMDLNEDIDVPGLAGLVVELYDDDNCDGTENAGGYIDAYTVDSTGEFTFTTSYDGDANGANAGDLHKDVSGPTDDGHEQNDSVFNNATVISIGNHVAGFRFKNLNALNSSSVIVDARLKLRAAGNSTGVVTLRIAFEDTSNAAAIQNGQTNLLSSRKNNLTSAIIWEIVEPWYDGQYYYSPNIASIMQEVINLPNFSLTNSNFLVFLIDDDNNGRNIRTKDYTGSGSTPELLIQYTDGTGSDCYVLKLNTDSKTPTPTITEGANGHSFSFTTAFDTATANFGVWGSAVPVTWLNFEANKFGPDASILNWSTSQEINNDYFTVQHSTDGVNFTDIGIVKGAGNSASAIHYEFIHGNPEIGVNYYRIKQTDFNGAFEYSVIRTVNFGEEGEITVNPNPSIDHVTVKIPETVVGETTVSVMDMAGKVILSQIVSEDDLNNGSTMVNLSTVQPGAYLITITSLTEVYTKRIIKK